MLGRDFPNLILTGFIQTSLRTPDYNCIAWAAGENSRWWWPDFQYVCYWPDNLARGDESILNFIKLFEGLGYFVCEDGHLEDEFEKVVLYANGDSVKHAARQLPSGKWTSKLGSNIDIEHTLEGLECPFYGQIIQFMKRSR